MFAIFAFLIIQEWALLLLVLCIKPLMAIITNDFCEVKITANEEIIFTTKNSEYVKKLSDVTTHNFGHTISYIKFNSDFPHNVSFGFSA